MYVLRVQNEPKIDFKTPPSANSFWNFAHMSPGTQPRRSRRKIMKKLNTWPYSYEEHIPLYLPLTAAVNGKWPGIILEQKSASIGECASVKLKKSGKPLVIQKKWRLNLETIWIYLCLPITYFYMYLLRVQNEPKIDLKTQPSTNSFWNFAHTSLKEQPRRSRRRIMKD